MKFSVIVPAYNCQATIVECLQAILKQSVTEEFEIIAVDDGSEDKTAELIKNMPQIKYKYQINAGPACARNTGASIARGDWLIFTDSDCVPRPDWVSRLLPHMQNEEVAAVAGSYGIRNTGFFLAECVYQEILYRHQTRMSEYISAFGSYNVAIRKKAFNEVGGFDGSYRFASGEDNDLSYKLLRAGYKIYFSKDSIVEHYHPVCLYSYLSEQFRHGVWRMKMYLQHPGMSRGDGYTFWKDILEIPLAVLCVVALVTGSFGAMNMLTLFWVALLFFFGLEIIFSVKMQGRSARLFPWAGIMFLRAFVRAAGLFWGGVKALVSSIPSGPKSEKET